MNFYSFFICLAALLVVFAALLMFYFYKKDEMNNQRLKEEKRAEEEKKEREVRVIEEYRKELLSALKERDKDKYIAALRQLGHLEEKPKA